MYEYITPYEIAHGKTAIEIRAGLNDNALKYTTAIDDLYKSSEIVIVSGTDQVDILSVTGIYQATITIDGVPESGQLEVINYWAFPDVRQIYTLNSDGSRWWRNSGNGNFTGISWSKMVIASPDVLPLVPQAVRPSYAKGKVWFDDEHMTPAYYTDVADVVFHAGIDIPIRIINKTGLAIPAGKAIRNGGIDIATGEIMGVLAKADSLTTSFVIGFTCEEVAIDAQSFVINQGHVHNIDTSLLVLGGILFLSATDAGEVVQTPPDIASALGTVQTVSDTVGEYFVKIDNLIAYPISHGYLRGQNTPQYTLLAGIKQDVANFTEIEDVILVGDKLLGTLAGSLGGSYVIDFTAIATFPSLVATRTLFFEVYNITQDKIEGAFPKNIPRDATTDGVSFTAPVRLNTGDVYKIKVYADVDIVINLTNCAFMLTSRHLGT